MKATTPKLNRWFPFSVVPRNAVRLRCALLALPFLLLRTEVISAQPANDNFSNRAPLDGLPVATPSVSLAQATLETGEPRLPVYTRGQTVWWTWISPVSGMISVSPAGSFRYPAVAFYSGNTLTNLTPVAEAVIGLGRVLPVPVQSGSTYQIQADAGSDSLDDLVLQLEAAPYIPTNDLFGDAVSLQGTNLVVNADNTFASAEPSEPQHTPTATGKSLWWKWVAPANGEIRLSTAGEGSWTETTVYTGDSFSTLQKLGSSSNKFNEPMFLGVRQGTTYRIAADSVDNTYGAFTMALNFTPTPLNDLFANRAALSPDSTVFGVSLGSPSREPGEPVLNIGRDATSGRTLWWTFTPPTPGTLQFSVQSEGSSTRVAMGVYTGTNLSSLKPVLKGQGFCSVKLQAGISYQIQVDPLASFDAWGTHVQALGVRSIFYPVPTNDTFANRIALIGPSVTVQGNTIGATRESGAPPGEPTIGASVWYTWTAPADGWAYLRAHSDSFIPVISVYQGTAPGKLRRLSTSFGAYESSDPIRAAFFVTAGAAYQIALDAKRSEGTMPGDFELNLEFSSVALTSPVNGMRYDASSPPALTLNSPNVAVDGDITRVQLVLLREGFQNFSIILSAPPFTFTPTNLPGGDYVAAAIALNNAGRTLLSPPVSFVLAPPGDNFTNAIQLAGYQWQLNATVAGASLERGEPAHSARRVDSSVWIDWTAPASGTAALTGNFPQSVHLEAYTGTNLIRLKRVPLTTTNGWFYSLNAAAGTTYHFAVCHRSMAPYEGEDFSLSLALPTVFILSPAPADKFTDLSTIPLRIATSEPSTNILNVSYFVDAQSVADIASAPFGTDLTGLRPGDHTLLATASLRSGWTSQSSPVSFHVSLANDFLTNAIVLTGVEASTRAWLYTATSEPGEPAITFPQKSAWWAWTAPQTARVWLDLDTTNAMPWVEVYTGPSVDNLTRADWSYRPGLNISHLEFRVLAGVTYYISVLDNHDVAGTLHLKVLAPPANDQFANRIVVAGTNVLLVSSLLEATEEPGEQVPPYGCGYPGRSVWWSWTAPAAGAATIAAAPSVSCVRIGVFTGDTLTNLVPITLSGEPSAVFETQPGQTYQIMMDNSEEINPLIASLTFVPAPISDFVANSSAPTVSSPLQISLAGQNLKLMWPADSSGQLEYSTSLATAAKWLPLTNAVTIDAGQKVISLPLESGSRFFRLR
jgi:hypothetical protein